MAIGNPTNLVTDYLLGALALYWGRLTWIDASENPHPSKKPWALALYGLAAASFLGGTYHSFFEAPPPAAGAILWRLTMVAIGLVSAAMLTAAASLAFNQPVARGVAAFAALKFFAFAIWIQSNPEFLWAILDYVPSMLVVLAVALWKARTGKPSGWGAAGGVLVSFAAAGIQQSGFSLHEHFNHNDLYHVVQVVGTYLLYRAGLKYDR